MTMLAQGRVVSPVASTSGRQTPVQPCPTRQVWLQTPRLRHQRRRQRQPQPMQRSTCISLQAAAGNGAPTVARPRPPYLPNRIDDPNYVRIFDTTLRDGEQSPGATLTAKEKLDIARQLVKMGIDIIEAGFPQASPGDFAAVKSIAETVGREVDDDGYVPVICGLARCVQQDAEVGLHFQLPRRLPAARQPWQRLDGQALCGMAQVGLAGRLRRSAISRRYLQRRI